MLRLHRIIAAAFVLLLLVAQRGTARGFQRNGPADKSVLGYLRLALLLGRAPVKEAAFAAAGCAERFFVNTPLRFEYLINVCLNCLSKCQSTCKRGNFIELRNGMINISPIGRSCSQEEREKFFEQDKIFKYRENLIKCIQGKWNEYMYESEEKQIELKFSIGGMISIDIFPIGWDKTYCLNFVQDKYDKICFFGDKTMEGGNDYEIFNDGTTIKLDATQWWESFQLYRNIPISW